MRRLLVATSAVALLGLTACGSGDDPAPLSLGSGSSDADGFSPEQRAAADAVEAYYAFLDAYQSGDHSGDFTTVLTDAEAAVVGPLVEQSVATTKQLGSTVFDPTDVAIDGETATVTGCRDATGRTTVPADTPDGAFAPPTATGQGQVVSFPVALTADGWRVSSAALGSDQEVTPCTVSP